MVIPGRDVPFRKFLHALRGEWSRDAVGQVAGAVTFFGVLSLFPFLLFLIALASVIIDPTQAEELVRQLARVAPAQATRILGEQIRRLGQAEDRGLLTVSALTAIWTASGGVVALTKALNTAYGVKESRPFWRTRGLAVLVTLGGAVFGIVATTIAVGTPAFADRLGGVLETLVLLLRFPVAAILMMFLWAVLYYLLPDVEQTFKFITPGSVTGVTLWLLASWGFSTYVANFGKFEATYGALGGAIVLLFWLWISAQVFLLGAEINALLEHWSPEGKRAGAKAMAERGADRSKTEKEARGEALLPHAGNAPPPPAPRPRFVPVPTRRPASLAQRAGVFATSLGLAFLVGRRLAR